MHAEIFSGKAEDYNKYRPKYPELLKEIITKKLNLASDKIVADIGSGTGISSEIFIDNGNLVFAIEPNEDMREIAEINFDFEENFVSVEGTAENTGLNDDSIDLIFVGTAFHWFDLEQAKTEFHRILKKDGHIVIAWNNRDLSDEFQQKLDDIFYKHFTKPTKVEPQKLGDGVKTFFAPKKFKQEETTFVQQLSFENLMGRLRSTSYFPEEDDKNFSKLVEEIYELFNKFQKDELIDFKYKTQIYWI